MMKNMIALILNMITMIINWISNSDLYIWWYNPMMIVVILIMKIMIALILNMITMISNWIFNAVFTFDDMIRDDRSDTNDEEYDRIDFKYD